MYLFPQIENFLLSNFIFSLPVFGHLFEETQGNPVGRINDLGVVRMKFREPTILLDSARVLFLAKVDVTESQLGKSRVLAVGKSSSERIELPRRIEVLAVVERLHAFLVSLLCNGLIGRIVTLSLREREARNRKQQRYERKLNPKS